MKRDILIFPKFINIDLIETIRQEYDRLYNVLPPHITIVFPFYDTITNEDLYNKLCNLLENQKSFDITFKGISISDDGYIFLNCVKGFENITLLHDLIYTNILPSHLNKNREYIPHITLGKIMNINESLPNLDVEFNTTVNELVIEIIGDNEESIIYKEIKLK